MFPLKNKKKCRVFEDIFSGTNMNKQSKKVKLCVIKHAALKNNRGYLLHTEITKSHLNNRICQLCGVKTSTVTPSFYYAFNIFLSCNNSIPSFFGNLCWVLLLRNHLQSSTEGQDSSNRSINIWKPKKIHANFVINKFEKCGRHVCRHFTAWFRARLSRRVSKARAISRFSKSSRAQSRNYREPVRWLTTVLIDYNKPQSKTSFYNLGRELNCACPLFKRALMWRHVSRARKQD